MNREEYFLGNCWVQAGCAIAAQFLGLVERSIGGGKGLMLGEYGGIDHR